MWFHVPVVETVNTESVVEVKLGDSGVVIGIMLIILPAPGCQDVLLFNHKLTLA